MQQAVCVRRRKKIGKKSRKKSPHPKTHHEIHGSPATATTSRRRAKSHVLRVSPYSPASMDTGFVETGLVQLSQPVKTTNVTYTLTDRLNSGTLYAPRYDEAFSPIGKKKSSVASLPRPCLIMKRLFCLALRPIIIRYRPNTSQRRMRHPTMLPPLQKRSHSCCHY